MNKAVMENIQLSDWEVHARNHPELYFSSADVTASAVAQAIEFSAKILGASKTEFIELDGWSYFCADVDWLFKSTHKFESIEQIFGGPGPFPEDPEQGAFRYESLCLPFSSDAFTHSEQGTSVLKGSPPPEDILEKHLGQLGSWGRIIGFNIDK